MTFREKEAPQASAVSQLLKDMDASAVEQSRLNRAGASKTRLHESAGIDNQELNRVRQNGTMSYAVFNKLLGLCCPTRRIEFINRYSDIFCFLEIPKSKQIKWRFPSNDASGWEYVGDALLSRFGFERHDLDNDVNSVIKSVIQDVRHSTDELTASNYALYLAQAAFVRYAAGTLKDHRILVTTVCELVNLAALTRRVPLLNRAGQLLSELVDKDDFARCLSIDSRAQIDEKRKHLRASKERYQVYSDLYSKMIHSPDTAKDFFVLHRAGLGSFLNYIDVCSQLGDTAEMLSDRL